MKGQMMKHVHATIFDAARNCCTVTSSSGSMFSTKIIVRNVKRCWDSERLGNLPVHFTLWGSYSKYTFRRKWVSKKSMTYLQCAAYCVK